MKKEDLIKKLENIEVPESEIQSHQRRLRLALLDSGYFKEKTTMSLLKKFAPIGGVIAIAAVIAVIGFAFKGTAPVSAQEIAQKSYQTVSALTSEQKETLKKEVHMIGDPLSVLEEAKNAKDLTILTYDQFVSQNPNMPMPDRQSIDWDNVKFLQFTNSDGIKITLGIDQNNLPILVTGSSFRNPDEASPTGEAGTSIMGTSIMGEMGEDGIFTVNGKKYTAPVDINGPSSVEVKDGEVYINGVKAIPQE